MSRTGQGTRKFERGAEAAERVERKIRSEVDRKPAPEKNKSGAM